MTADERIVALEDQLKRAMERVQRLEEQLAAAQKRIEELEKQKTPPPAFAKANVKKPGDHSKVGANRLLGLPNLARGDFLMHRPTLK